MSAAQDTKTNSSHSHDDLSKQIEALRNDFTELSDTFTDDMSDGVEQAGRQIQKSGKRAGKMATRAVRGNPLLSVGVAAGVGLLVGLIARRV